MIITKRKFGVEIETIGLTNSKAKKIFSKIEIPFLSGEYDDCPRCGSYVYDEDGMFYCADCSWLKKYEPNTKWSWHEDSSIDDRRGNGLEVVSPILSGSKGLYAVKKVAKALEDAGISANNTCGLHVHVDARDLTLYDLVNTLRRYDEYENKIDALMPNIRVGNCFCLSTKLDVKNILSHLPKENTKNKDTIRRFLERNFNDRYRKLNLSAYLVHGTIEFRQHEGTVDSTTIVNWIRFCVNFVEQSKIRPRNINEIVPLPEDSLFRKLPKSVTKFYQQRREEMIK